MENKKKEGGDKRVRGGGEWEEKWEGKGGERRERGRKREGGGEGGKGRGKKLPSYCL